MSEEEKSKRLWELDDGISKMKKKIAEYQTAVVKGKEILEILEARRARLLSGRIEVDGE